MASQMACAVAGAASWLSDVGGSGSGTDVVGSGYVAVGAGDGVEVSLPDGAGS